jgi:hypothetical protein
LSSGLEGDTRDIPGDDWGTSWSQITRASRDGFDDGLVAKAARAAERADMGEEKGMEKNGELKLRLPVIYSIQFKVTSRLTEADAKYY